MNDIAYHIITTEIIMERSECYSYISFVALWVFILKIFDIYLITKKLIIIDLCGTN